MIEHFKEWIQEERRQVSSLTFEGCMKFTRTIGNPTSFEDEECMAYYHLLNLLPNRSSIVEIGLEYGRSSSIALQVAKAKSLNYHGIDPWIGHEDVMRSWIDMACRTGSIFNLHVMRSYQCILIDGDHTRDGVIKDIQHMSEFACSGINGRGYILFHDYEMESSPEVTDAVNSMGKTFLADFNKIGLFGSLLVLQRK